MNDFLSVMLGWIVLDIALIALFWIGYGFLWLTGRNDPWSMYDLFDCKGRMDWTGILATTSIGFVVALALFIGANLASAIGHSLLG